MLVAAAVCPHPPLLVPGLGGAADVLEGVRRACLAAVGDLLAVAPDVLVLVGGGERTRRHASAAAGSLRPWGLDVRVGRPRHGEPVLPLSLTVGRWLVEQACADPAAQAVAPALVLQEVAASLPPADAATLGAALGGGPTSVALLALGDGSARLRTDSPGWLDPRGLDWDARCAAAVEDADPAALAGLEPGLGAELLTAGRAAWQVLGGAAAAAGSWDGELRLHEAPLGVSYLVAVWRPRAAAVGR